VSNEKKNTNSICDINMIIILDRSQNKVVLLKNIDLIDNEENNIIDKDDNDKNWLLFYIILQNKLYY